MEEKVILQSVPYNTKAFFKKLLFIGIIVGVIVMLLSASESYTPHVHNKGCYLPQYKEEYGQDWRNGYFPSYKLRCEYQNVPFSDHILYHLDILDGITPVLLALLIGGIVHFSLRKTYVSVTNKRVCGKLIFGKKVAIPLEKITSAEAHCLTRGLTVSTASRTYRFRAIKNADELYKAINTAVVERLYENAHPAAPVAPPTEEERLATYRAMLKRGEITKKDFNKKKAQILGL